MDMHKKRELRAKKKQTNKEDRKDENKNSAPVTINWYPGHMKKTRELIEANLKLVDIVVEVVDARIPSSSRNPIIDQIVKDKKRIIFLNKVDLSDEQKNKEWKKKLERDNTRVVLGNCMLGDGIKQLFAMLDKEQEIVNKEKNRNKPLRMMIVGVPNVGKSSLINRMTGKKSTQTGDRPGVTKGKQWISIKNGMQLLDTPGILWPKFEDPNVGLNLAFCGSIKDEILDISELSFNLFKVLLDKYEDMLLKRYKMEKEEIEDREALEIFELVGEKRGFMKKGGNIDYERLSKTILDEFRAAKIGRITLEEPVVEALEELQEPESIEDSFEEEKELAEDKPFEEV